MQLTMHIVYVPDLCIYVCVCVSVCVCICYISNAFCNWTAKITIYVV